MIGVPVSEIWDVQDKCPVDIPDSLLFARTVGEFQRARANLPSELVARIERTMVTADAVLGLSLKNFDRYVEGLTLAERNRLMGEL
jgi:hypothetical protein